MSINKTRTKLGQKTPKIQWWNPINTVNLGPSLTCHPSPHPDFKQKRKKQSRCFFLFSWLSHDGFKRNVIMPMPPYS